MSTTWYIYYIHSFGLLYLSCSVPVGLEDVSKYPSLFAELIERGYSDEDVWKIARLNLIRVFKDVERVSHPR